MYTVLPEIQRYFEYILLPKIEYKNLKKCETEVNALHRRSDTYFWFLYTEGDFDLGYRICLPDNIKN